MTNQTQILEALVKIDDKLIKVAEIQQQVLVRLDYINGSVGSLKKFKDDCPTKREVITERINKLENKWLYGLISVIFLTGLTIYQVVN